MCNEVKTNNNIIINSNEQSWLIQNALLKAGYEKTADCYWFMVFKKGDSEVHIERE